MDLLHIYSGVFWWISPQSRASLFVHTAFTTIERLFPPDAIAPAHHLQKAVPLDLALPVGEAQHLSDIPIMAGLERHPLRTWDADAADLHVIGALPYASHVLALMSGEVAAHRRRMNALTAALGALSPFIGRNKKRWGHCRPSSAEKNPYFCCTARFLLSIWARHS